MADPLANVCGQGARWSHFNGVANNSSERSLQSSQGQEAWRPIEVHKQVNIRLTRVAAHGDASEDLRIPTSALSDDVENGSPAIGQSFGSFRIPVKPKEPRDFRLTSPNCSRYLTLGESSGGTSANGLREESS